MEGVIRAEERSKLLPCFVCLYLWSDQALAKVARVSYLLLTFRCKLHSMIRYLLMDVAIFCANSLGNDWITSWTFILLPSDCAWRIRIMSYMKLLVQIHENMWDSTRGFPISTVVTSVVLET